MEAVAIQRCGSGQLWDSLKLGREAHAGRLAALFQTGFVFPCWFFSVVLFYSRNKRADYCSPSGERKGRGDPCADFLWRLSQMVVEGECAKKLNHCYSVIPEAWVFQNAFGSHIMPTSWMLSSEMFPRWSCGALMRKSLFELQGLVSCLLEK